MRTIQSFVIAAVLAMGGDMLPVQADDAAAVNEILRLKSAGLAEETIVAFIRSQNRNYDLSAENVIGLRQQGVSLAVMNAMLESGQTAVPSTPPPEPVYAPQPATPPAGPPTTMAQPALNQDVAYFHQELSPYGRWILSEENQWYWQPTVAVGNLNWRPYWDQGHWVYTDQGWYWSSDYPWGWAAFHYGRWNLHPHHGWIWYPDREWAPAWVSWRMGGDYCGWAPLPQYSHYDYVTGGLSFHGSHVEASFGFGLAWNQFNFSYLREMGDRPRARFRRETDARRIFNQTTVINNYSVSKTVINNEARPRIVNQGIDPGRVAAVRGKPVETVRIQDRRTPAPAGMPERVDARTKTLEVYRPKLPEPGKPLNARPVVTSAPRTSMPPSPSERGKVLPTKTQPSPAAPATGPRNVSPNPRVAPARPSMAPHPTEPRMVQPAAPPTSPAKPASDSRNRPPKSPKDSQ